jgi:protoheme IX farnesyltransferase
MNGISALGGYFLFPAPVQPSQILAVFAGVSLLAMGSSALNQVFDQDIDIRMLRTRFRPLPQGEIQPSNAIFYGLVAVFIGCASLAIAGGIIPVMLGLAAVAWYLLVYTPLKRRTVLALPIGAICGSMPPLIGWCLAGGTLSDFRIVIVSCLLFIWQIPHFWLLHQRHVDDYRSVGIKFISDRLGNSAACYFQIVWVIGLINISLLLPALNIIDHRMVVCYVIFTMLLLFPFVISNHHRMRVCYSLYPLMLTLTFLLQKTLW